MKSHPRDRVSQNIGYIVRTLTAGALALVAACWPSGTVAQTALEVTLSVPDGTQIAEGAGNTGVTVTASIARARRNDLIIDLSFGGTAKSADYKTAGTIPAITIESGQTTGTADITLSAVDDAYFEGVETLSVEGSVRGRSRASAVTSAEITIADNDSAPQLFVTVNPPGISLNEGSQQQFEITARLVGGGTFEEAETVTVSLADDNQVELPSGGFEKDGRYMPQAPPWTLTLAAGGRTSTTTRVTFSARDDNVGESREEARLVAEITAVGTTISRPFKLFTLQDKIKYATFSIFCRQRPAYTGTLTTDCWATASNRQAQRSYVVTMTADKPELVNPDSVTFNVDSNKDSSEPKSVTFEVDTGAAGETVSWNLSVRPDVGLEKALLSGLRAYIWPAPDSTYQISNYDFKIITSELVNVRTVGEPAVEVVFATLRPFTLVGPAHVEIKLDSGKVEAPCTVAGARIVCRYSVQEGDHDFDGQVEFPAGGVKFTGWRDARDTSVSGGVASPLPAQEVSYTGFPLIFGGAEAIDLSVSPQSLQEGTGEQKLTITAQKIKGAAAATDLVMPLSIADITTSPEDYSTKGPMSVTIPAG